MQRGEQHVPLSARLVPAERDVRVANRITYSSIPTGRWFAEKRVNRLALLGCRFRVE
jgi:hypothetical protein